MQITILVFITFLCASSYGKLILLHVFSLHFLWLQTQYAQFPSDYNPTEVKHTVDCWSKEIL